MTSKQTHNLILTLAIALCLASVGALYWGFKSPVAVTFNISTPLKPDAQPLSQPEISAGQKAEQELAELQELCQTELHRPLNDPPAAQSVVVAQSTLPLSLVGWINEPNHSMAILRKPDSTLQVCAVGDAIDLQNAQAIILSISPHSAKLRVNNEIHELTLQLPELPHD